MKTIQHLILILLVISGLNAMAQDKKDLQVKKGKSITLNYSEGISQKEAQQYINRVENAIDYYQELIGGNKIDLNMFVLKKNHWKGYAYVPMYGMPHAGYDKLVMAYEDNELWNSLIPAPNALSEKEMASFSKIYAGKKQDINMKVFWDLLSIHELGHVIANQNNVNITKLWFNEFFANYFLHCYIAKNEKELIPQLEESPRVNMEILKGEKFTSLDEFENNYGSKMTGKNYVWYQAHIQNIAKLVYDRFGDEPLKLIFTKFKNNERKFASSNEMISFIEMEISPEIAEYFRNF